MVLYRVGSLSHDCPAITISYCVLEASTLSVVPSPCCESLVWMRTNRRRTSEYLRVQDCSRAPQCRSSFSPFILLVAWINKNATAFQHWRGKWLSAACSVLNIVGTIVLDLYLKPHTHSKCERVYMCSHCSTGNGKIKRGQRSLAPQSDSVLWATGKKVLSVSLNHSQHPFLHSRQKPKSNANP